MRPHKTQLDERGRAKLHADIAHPINQACRDLIQNGVLKAFNTELEKSKQEGYRPPRDYYGDAGPEGSDRDIDEESPGSGSSGSQAAPEKKPEGGKDAAKDGEGNMGIFS
mgnify:CR=1 FL=1